MILAPDRSKMSKRHGATTVEEFRDQGILPEALVNYLVASRLVARRPGDLLARRRSSTHFDLEHVGKAGAVFDQAKL